MMSGEINKQACRVCLKEDAQQINIFVQPSRKECFAMMLTAITDIKISKGDSLPENICKSCSDVLIKAHKLKALAVKTNAYLLLKSKQIIIKKLDPELIKFQYPFKNTKFQSTIKAEPKVEKDDLFSNKINIETDMFDAKPTKKNVVRKDDFFSKPVIKSTKDDTFFTDYNINDNEVIFEIDDHFADNDGFDISYTTSNEPVVKKPRLNTPVTKQVRQSVQKTAPVKRRAQVLKKNVTSFKQKKYLTKKKSKVPKQSGSDYTGAMCTVCGVLTHNIRQHMNTHREHKFTCPVCKMGFAKKSQYHEHEITHDDVVRNFACEVCPMRFFTNKALRRHKSNHAEKTFECDHCPYKINSRWALTRHIRRHLGVKPYTCECGQAFVDRGQLAQHSRIHTGEKLFTCQICNIEFSYKANLNNHVLKAHGVNIRFQSIHKVTEESLQMVLQRAALQTI